MSSLLLIPACKLSSSIDHKKLLVVCWLALCIQSLGFSIAMRQCALMAFYTLFQGDAEHLACLEDVIQCCLLSEPSKIASTSMVMVKVCRCVFFFRVLTTHLKLKHSEHLWKILNSQLQCQYKSNEPSSVLSILWTLRRGELKSVHWSLYFMTWI